MSLATWHAPEGSRGGPLNTFGWRRSRHYTPVIQSFPSRYIQKPSGGMQSASSRLVWSPSERSRHEEIRDSDDLPRRSGIARFRDRAPDADRGLALLSARPLGVPAGIPAPAPSNPARTRRRGGRSGARGARSRRAGSGGSSVPARGPRRQECPAGAGMRWGADQGARVPVGPRRHRALRLSTYRRISPTMSVSKTALAPLSGVVAHNH